MLNLVASLVQISMNIKIFVSSIFCLVTFVSGTDVHNSKESDHDTQYELVFSDEFNMPNGSQPDNKKWSRCKRYNIGWNRWISNSLDVVFIKNGKLICRAIPNTKEPNDTAPMLTGAIETKGKINFKYGRVDVRLKTNNKEGNFPAAWMKPEEGNVGKPYGEIDIFEGCGSLGVAQQTIHSQMTIYENIKDQPTLFRKRLSLNKWHIYSVVWTPSYVAYEIDGVETGRYEKSSDKKLLNIGQWTFDRPFFLIINQSVGNGKYKGMKPLINDVYETQFDWIRVYKLKE